MAISQIYCKQVRGGWQRELHEFPVGFSTKGAKGAASVAVCSKVVCPPGSFFSAASGNGCMSCVGNVYSEGNACKPCPVGSLAPNGVPGGGMESCQKVRARGSVCVVFACVAFSPFFRPPLIAVPPPAAVPGRLVLFSVRQWAHEGPDLQHLPRGDICRR